MSVMLKEPITGPAAWVAADVQEDGSWLHVLSDAEIAGIDAAVVAARGAGVSYPKMTAGDVDFGFLEPKFAVFREELENGRGFLLLRGLPVERYTEDEVKLIYYGIGLHLGVPVGQNPQGDLLGNVMAVGDPAKKETRVFQTNLYLPYHTDPSDVVGLLCLRKAKTGGLSSLVSMASVYNEILAHHPELLGLFYKQFYYAYLGEGEPKLTSLFSYHEGKLSARYLRQYIELGHEQMNLPLSSVEIEALDTFDRIMHDPKLRIDMMLEPGDLQFANNYAVLHSRTDFEDHMEEEKRRKMLRLWLKMDNARTPGPEFPGRNGFDLPAEQAAP
ncbi:TauD/TfdA family dioxygenase [Amylibacter sp. IMCC11727]|uniref:TauD/TfdA family dioxygenase n=1 Tax=Amylibacter sp. IMCC11727 TaxID=3039851 RepID=UPI00244D99A6|nr:TauD/TfdA family dioxygenase [Amylibacter sp. IMCC11727]WGI22454.1 TauD/TfdA family dioxygenase [Amylibacter sp. IMCC11727]